MHGQESTQSGHFRSATELKGPRARWRRNPDNVARNEAEDQFIHLIRLAWDLRALGVGITIELPRGSEPYVTVPRARATLRILAVRVNGTWVFSWGRGRSVAALDERAAARIRDAVRT